LLLSSATARRLACAGALALLAACGSTPPPTTADYLDEVAGITAALTRNSVAALPQGATPTRLQVDTIQGLRGAALADISALVPTDEIRPEHLALIGALEDLVMAGRAFLDGTAGLDQTEFVTALDVSTEIDALAADVHAACFALEKRSIELGHPVDLAC